MIKRVRITKANIVDFHKLVFTLDVEYGDEIRRIHLKAPSKSMMIGARDINRIIIDPEPQPNSRKNGYMVMARYYETLRRQRTSTAYVMLSSQDFKKDWSALPLYYLSPSPSLGDAYNKGWHVSDTRLRRNNVTRDEIPYEGELIEQGFICKSRREARLANICS